jgi:hypothetical protein
MGSTSTLHEARIDRPSPITSLSLTSTQPPGTVGWVDAVDIVSAIDMKYLSRFFIYVGSPTGAVTGSIFLVLAILTTTLYTIYIRKVIIYMWS